MRETKKQFRQRRGNNRPELESVSKNSSRKVVGATSSGAFLVVSEIFGLMLFVYVIRCVAFCFLLGFSPTCTVRRAL